MFDYRRSKYAIERYRFEQWAIWCDRENLGAIGGGASPLARMMDYRARIQAGRSSMPIPLADPVYVVTALMEELRLKDPGVHEALLARHRHYVQGSKVDPIYDRGRYRTPEWLLAASLYGDRSQAAVQKLRRECFEGYEILRPRLLPLAKKPAVCHSDTLFS